MPMGRYLSSLSALSLPLPSPPRWRRGKRLYSARPPFFFIFVSRRFPFPCRVRLFSHYSRAYMPSPFRDLCASLWYCRIFLVVAVVLSMTTIFCLLHFLAWLALLRLLLPGTCIHLTQQIPIALVGKYRQPVRAADEFVLKYALMYATGRVRRDVIAPLGCHAVRLTQFEETAGSPAFR